MSDGTTSVHGAAPGDTASEPAGSWLRRHWKRAGCFGCIGCGVMMAALIVVVLLTLYGTIRSSDAYNVAVEAARSDPRVAEALGDPIEVGWFVSGSIEVSGPSGEADLSIPLSGPKDQGRLYVVAHKAAGAWTFERIEFAVAGTSQRIDLMPAPEQAPAP